MCAGTEITEAQFWEQTLRSIRFHRQRMQAAADEYVQAQLIPTLNARDNREVRSTPPSSRQNRAIAVNGSETVSDRWCCIL